MIDDYQLTYDSNTPQQRTEKKRRRRNITWYNPPYSKNVATNVGKKFLNIVRPSFGNGHPLKKIFNKNTLKVSYSCIPSLEKKISTHNKAKLDATATAASEQLKTCNCRNQVCPLGGQCLTNNVIYQSTVNSTRGEETYISLTGDTFKSRFNNHTASFRNRNKSNPTELSKYIWDLKDTNTEFSLSWKTIARAAAYSNATKHCNLCITEKFFILCKPNLCTLNKRNEFASAWRHPNNFLLRNV